MPDCILFSLSFPSFVAVLHISYQRQGLSLHMSISKVSVTELQWNPNPDVNVTGTFNIIASNLC